MTKKELMDSVLARIDASKRDVFIKAVTAAEDIAGREKVLKEYGITLTAEEEKALKSKEMTDEDLEMASGGCGGHCSGKCSSCGSMD